LKCGDRFSPASSSSSLLQLAVRLCPSCIKHDLDEMMPCDHCGEPSMKCYFCRTCVCRKGIGCSTQSYTVCRQCIPALQVVMKMRKMDM
jgi:hypothetical protein